MFYVRVCNMYVFCVILFECIILSVVTDWCVFCFCMRWCFRVKFVCEFFCVVFEFLTCVLCLFLCILGVRLSVCTF